MEFIQLAQKRYATKAYSSTKISAEKIAELKEILRLSPSSINSQSWHFIFISSPELKERLAQVSLFNELKVRECSHLVVFCHSTVERFEQQAERVLSERTQAYYDTIIKTQGDEAVSVWTQKQVYLSLGYFLSACASMGIDSTPLEGIDIKAFNEILQVDGYRVLVAAAIGYRDPQDKNQPSITPKSRLPLSEVIEER